MRRIIKCSCGPDISELKEVVLSMKANGTTGIDGFNNAQFYQSCWDIIEADLFDVISDFFTGGAIPKGATSTTITLIPKTKAPQCWGGFVQGRNVHHNILSAQEVVHAIDKKSRGGNTMVKLDISKAFDRLSWEFLQLILKRFGFSQDWIDRVATCINSCWFSIIFNGELAGYFQSKCGVRQGDPLSPSLFIIAEEYLIRGLDKIFSEYPGMYFNAAYEEIESLHSTLSGCLWQNMVGRVTQFTKGSLPFKYLGIPIYKGKKHIFLFDELVEKIRRKIGDWQVHKLSYAGRLTLIRDVLYAYPIYFMQSIQIPKFVLNRIEKLFNRFLWSASDHSNGIRWCSWNKVCMLFEEGGLSVRSLHDIQKVCSMKIWFQFWKQTSLWSSFRVSKYCKNSHPSIRSIPAGCSKIWRRMQNIRDEAEPHLHWQIGQGDCDFWLDNWLSKGRLLDGNAHREVGIAEIHKYCENGAWNIDLLKGLFPKIITDQIQVDINHDTAD
ncbi:reverse transcriptase [Lithospermum erythrorhizon]|uniref:Reverse transcriptase n=1 Tax=Lithospermum erythrorhizon TaxID=34254 RepID=A0AAV3RYJ1_LITER